MSDVVAWVEQRIAEHRPGAQLERFDAEEWPDDDRLNYLGLDLTQTSHDEQDRVAVRWLSERPSARHLGLVSQLFVGLWHSHYRQKPIEYRVVDELLQIRQRLLEEGAITHDWVFESLGQAFEGTAASHEVKARIAEVLRGAMKAPEVSSELADYMQQILKEQGFG